MQPVGQRQQTNLPKSKTAYRYEPCRIYQVHPDEKGRHVA